jgi:hypothetical protein
LHPKEVFVLPREIGTALNVAIPQDTAEVYHRFPSTGDIK